MNLESLSCSKFKDQQISQSQMYSIIGGGKRKTGAGTGKVKGYDNVEMAWDSDKNMKDGTITYKNLRPADCDCR